MGKYGCPRDDVGAAEVAGHVMARAVAPPLNSVKSPEKKVALFGKGGTSLPELWGEEWSARGIDQPTRV